MALFLAKTGNGVVGFYDDTLGPVPSLRVSLTQEEYSTYLTANHRGARLDIVNTGTDAAPALTITAKDWQGHNIDLSRMTDASSYWEPVAPVPLKEQAKDAMQAVMAATQSHGWGVFAEMPADVTAYGRALSAIISGTDTTSTALPATPVELAEITP